MNKIRPRNKMHFDLLDDIDSTDFDIQIDLKPKYANLFKTEEKLETIYSSNKKEKKQESLW
jgi:hypothetical protein